jgi:hypothetical protein
MGRNGSERIAWAGRAAGWTLVLAAILGSGGCADYLREKQLESVAKGWCQTIRASQVIPVYPLTADLRPGDVFMVQTPIASQASVYRQRGFLALDDHRTRLKKPGYGGVYFDGYFKDPYIVDPSDPHDYPSRKAEFFTGEDAAEKARASLSAAAAPRAAFPTYTFEVSSGLSGAAALPIQGIPVGLNFLNTQKASGTVTIADARTYGASEEALYEGLTRWAPVYLRVVSRVYLTGAVVVSLSRSDAGGAGVEVGKAPKVPPMTDENGDLNPSYQQVLDALNTKPDPVTELAEAGGALQFVAASSSTVTMAESFDTLLVIGYLGFDVPVYRGGVLGAPIPTFERLEGRGPDTRPDAANLSPQQARYKVGEAALEALIENDPDQALRVMTLTVRSLDAGEFWAVTKTTPDSAAKLLRVAARTKDETRRHAAIGTALKSFKRASSAYVSAGGNSGPRYDRYSDAFEHAFDRRDEE